MRRICRADGPEQVLGGSPLFQRQVPGAEQIDGRVEPLLRVVERLEHVARLEFVERVVEIANRLRGGVSAACSGIAIWLSCVVTPSTLNSRALW